MTLPALSGASELNRVLLDLNNAGHFSSAILTDRHGLAIASAHDPGLDPEKQAAIAALVQKSANQAGRQLGLAEAHEITLHMADGQRLISRAFRVGEYDLLLSITLPPAQKSYRRMTGQAIREIQQIWVTYWE